MRTITPCIIMLALLISCRSHKEVQRETIVDSDSVATTASHQTFASLDSVISRLYFDFDTLEIEWNSEMGIGDSISQSPVPSPRRLRVVKGRVASNRSQYRKAEEAKTRLDSTAYKISSADTSAEHTATTAVYDPPNSTTIICFSIALALILFVIYRKTR